MAGRGAGAGELSACSSHGVFTAPLPAEGHHSHYMGRKTGAERLGDGSKVTELIRSEAGVFLSECSVSQRWPVQGQTPMLAAMGSQPSDELWPPVLSPLHDRNQNHALGGG